MARRKLVLSDTPIIKRRKNRPKKKKNKTPLTSPTEVNIITTGYLRKLILDIEKKNTYWYAMVSRNLTKVCRELLERMEEEDWFWLVCML